MKMSHAEDIYYMVTMEIDKNSYPAKAECKKQRESGEIYAIPAPREVGSGMLCLCKRVYWIQDGYLFFIYSPIPKPEAVKLMSDPKQINIMKSKPAEQTNLLRSENGGIYGVPQLIGPVHIQLSKHKPIYKLTDMANDNKTHESNHHPNKSNNNNLLMASGHENKYDGPIAAEQNSVASVETLPKIESVFSLAANDGKDENESRIRHILTDCIHASNEKYAIASQPLQSPVGTRSINGETLARVGSCDSGVETDYYYSETDEVVRENGYLEAAAIMEKTDSEASFEVKSDNANRTRAYPMAETQHVCGDASDVSTETHDVWTGADNAQTQTCDVMMENYEENTLTKDLANTDYGFRVDLDTMVRLNDASTQTSDDRITPHTSTTCEGMEYAIENINDISAEYNDQGKWTRMANAAAAHANSLIIDASTDASDNYRVEDMNKTHITSAPDVYNTTNGVQTETNVPFTSNRTKSNVTATNYVDTKVDATEALDANDRNDGTSVPEKVDKQVMTECGVGQPDCSPTHEGLKIKLRWNKRWKIERAECPSLFSNDTSLFSNDTSVTGRSVHLDTDHTLYYAMTDEEMAIHTPKVDLCGSVLTVIMKKKLPRVRLHKLGKDSLHKILP
ncbi:uncharacterized protein [Amphiura filiformis]|uniref:uncharacterized protein isoform X2 n=1 Tax=Amphiura filiformis TaxID=82378 RepID=UPI003B21A02A